MNTKSIAILGCTGHVGKNLIFNFQKEKNFDLFLFSRHEQNIRKTITDFNLKDHFTIKNYEQFNESEYDAIINCIGISDPAKIIEVNNSILEITEKYDNLVLDYLKKYPLVNYVNFSSGAVYGGDFISPVNSSTKIEIPNYKISPYTLSKIKSEIKHRNLKNFNIIDVRLFSFFSRYMDINTKFLISEIVSSIKYDKKFVTNKIDIFRDYINPEDLFNFIKICINLNSNCGLDVYSKESVSKFSLLKYLEKHFNLKYEMKEDVSANSPTGIKKNYFSKSREAAKFGFIPQFTSIETISQELKHFLKSNLA